MLNNKDKLAFRLTYIIVAFNNGDRLQLKDLAKEFNVNLRTIYRDIKRLEQFLPLKKENGYISLDEYHLSKYSLKDFLQFKKVSGIEKLYPDDFSLGNILDKDKSNNLKVTINFANINKKEIEFERIQNAINDKRIISFIYKNKKRIVKPYQLLNKQGVWYIVGVENEILKTFTLEKIKLLNVLKKYFELDVDILQNIKNNSSWYSNNPFEVLLEVDNDVLYYFKRKEIFPNQTIIEYKKDTFFISTIVAFEDEILRLVYYWIPYVKIISPNELNEKLKENIDHYLCNI